MTPPPKDVPECFGRMFPDIENNDIKSLWRQNRIEMWRGSYEERDALR